MIVIVKAVKNNYSHAAMLITGPEIKIKDWHDITEFKQESIFLIKYQNMSLAI